MSDNALFERAERAHAETLRLQAEGIIRAEETLKRLHRCAIRYEETMQVLGRAIKRLAAAGRQSVAQRMIADANRNRPSRVL